MSAFNAIFADARELAEASLRDAIAELAGLHERFAAMQLPLRRDHARSWEHARVLREIDAIAAGRALSILDVGGGNSAPAWLLAARGHRVTVLDADCTVTAAVWRTSRLLNEGHRVTAAGPIDGRWPVAAAAFDAAICISVFEGVLRRDRPRFFAELRRALRPGGEVLVTFDFGPDARFVGDPPVTIAEVEREIVEQSGLELVGALPAPPTFDGDRAPPVRGVARAADGSVRPIAYTFGALRLRRPR